MLLPIPRHVATLLLAGLLPAVVIAAGCSAMAARQEVRSGPNVPSWTAAEPTDHLRMFNVGVDDRATGSPGYARAAAYVAARMRVIGLQPALGEAFRLLYQTPINHPRAAILAAVGEDTLRFLPGIDHLPDARSDSGATRTYEAFIDPSATASDGASLAGRVVFAPSAEASTNYLVHLRAAGVRAVILVGPLHPRQAANRVADLVIVQATPGAAAQLLGGPASAVFATAGPVTMPRAVAIRVAAEHQPFGSGINTLGYVPGAHPVLANELVLVCSDLDAAPSLGGGRTLDFEHFGIGTAALLKAAERASYMGARSGVPERSMLFAVWSGARLGHVGLRAYLRSPLWPLDATRAVVYVGLRAEDEPGVRALLAEYDLPLYVVPASTAPLSERPVVHVPSAVVRRQAIARGRLELQGEDRTPGVNLSAVIAQAADEAVRLAQEAADLSLSLAVSPAPPVPVAGDGR